MPGSQVYLLYVKRLYAVALLFSFLHPLPVLSYCFNLARCLSQKIGADTLSVSCWIGDSLALKDTFCRADQVKALKNEFDTTVYCFQGIIDSVIRFRTSPKEGSDPCVNYVVDSVHVKTLAVYKGTVPDAYWFIDTIISAYCDTSRPIWIEDGDPSFKRIKGSDPFIAFGRTIGNLRKSKVATGGCEAKSGYFISKNGMVYKCGVWYPTPSETVIDYSSIWIEMTLAEFLDALGVVVATRVPTPETVDFPSFRVIRSPCGISVESWKEQVVYLSVFGLDGRLIATQSVRVGRERFFRPWSGGALGSGIRLVKISDGRTAQTLIMGAW